MSKTFCKTLHISSLIVTDNCTLISVISNSCTKKLKINETDEGDGKSEKEDGNLNWEVLSKQEHLSVMRRQMESGLYEYKGMIYNCIKY